MGLKPIPEISKEYKFEFALLRVRSAMFEWSRVRFTSGAMTGTCSSEVERSIADIFDFFLRSAKSHVKIRLLCTKSYAIVISMEKVPRQSIIQFNHLSIASARPTMASTRHRG